LKAKLWIKIPKRILLTRFNINFIQCEIQYQILNNNGEHGWKWSPLDYRWRCGRSGPAFVMISQHAFTAMCLCYLSINSFLWFFIYLLYNIINDTENVKIIHAGHTLLLFKYGWHYIHEYLTPSDSEGLNLMNIMSTHI
jgi:hypothetical protein